MSKLVAIMSALLIIIATINLSMFALPYINLAIIVCFYDLVRHSKKALTSSLDV